MITTTLGQLADAKDALIAVASLALPAKSAYRVSKLCRKVDPDIRAFFEQRNALVVKYGTPEEGKEGSFRVDPYKVSDFAREFQELRAVTVEVDEAPIDLAWLEDQNIEGKHLLALGPLLIEAEQ